MKENKYIAAIRVRMTKGQKAALEQEAQLMGVGAGTLVRMILVQHLNARTPGADQRQPPEQEREGDIA